MQKLFKYDNFCILQKENTTNPASCHLCEYRKIRCGYNTGASAYDNRYPSSGGVFR